MVQTEVRAGWSTGGRGCEEQILTTRLLIDISRKCKLALWVAFIDYKKAYDMVDRRTLLQLLDEKGCGTTFLKAVGASLVHSMGMVGGETFSTFTGVRQGASSSWCIPWGWSEGRHSPHSPVCDREPAVVAPFSPFSSTQPSRP